MKILHACHLFDGITKRTLLPAVAPRQRDAFRVRRLGMTGRVALLLLATVISPMLATCWMIEHQLLIPEKNIYIALPLLALILLLPLSRALAHCLFNRDLRVINQFCTPAQP